ncbi:MAG: hypothetical protein AB7Q97_25195 [Gammaproteobacteria bacterium]
MAPASRLRFERLVGVDFTSAPRRAKPITAAHARREGGRVVIERIESLVDFPAFEALLARPGPRCGRFDFPFGMPAVVVRELGWPQPWAAMVRHCAGISRAAIVRALGRGAHPLGLRLACDAPDLAASLMEDGTGDRLDAVLCAIQAAWCAGRPRSGLPADVPACEGWIATVPG